ncbi:MAG: vWA domain-containing protein [bacterium]
MSCSKRRLAPLCAALVAVAGFVSLPGISAGQEAFDVFFLLDATKSMTGNSGEAGFVNIFDEVSNRLIKDIKSRQAGEHVAIYTFSRDVLLLQEKTIQAQSDYEYFEKKLHELKADGDVTWLERSIYTVFQKAREYAKSNPTHLVELRIYTDDLNNGPTISSNQWNEIGIARTEYPNLQLAYCPYRHPGNTNSGSDRIAKEFPPIPINTVFVRVRTGNKDYGNLRSQQFVHRMPMVLFFDEDVKGRAFNADAKMSAVETDLPLAAGLLVNVRPRPLYVTDERVDLMFEVANPAEVPADARVGFKGEIQFKAERTDATNLLNVAFTPRFLPIAGRIAPVSEIVLSIEGAAIDRVGTNVVHLGLTRQNLIYTDRGVNSTLMRFKVGDRIRMNQSQKLTLRIQTPAAELSGVPIAAFVTGASDSSEGKRQVEVTADTKEVMLRVDYSPRNLMQIRQPGAYPVEILVEANDPDLVAEFSMVGSASPSRRPADCIRIFPCLPPNVAGYNTTKLDGSGGRLIPPPPVSRRWVVSAVIAIIAGLLLSWLGLPRSFAVALALIYFIAGGLLGVWYNPYLALPTKWYVGWVWLVVSVWTVIHPPPFRTILGSLVFWQRLRLRREDQTFDLAAISEAKGKSMWLGGSYSSRNTLSELELDPSSGKNRYVFEYPRWIGHFVIRVKLSSFQENSVEVLVNGQWEPVVPGVEVALHALPSSFRVDGTEHTFNKL